MPEYVYRAVMENGLMVRNRVEATSKQNLVAKLKSNGLIPINIIQVRFASKNKKMRKNRN